jgi:hypothetical protein
MITPEDIWLGDWHTKIRSRIHAQGFDTVTNFVQRHPCLPYHKLARLIGNDIAAVQLAVMQFEEAKDGGYIRNAAKDALCRTIHENLKRGWKQGIHSDFRTANAYSSWLAILEFRAFLPDLVPLGVAVWDALESSNPPTGWAPSDPSDQFIEQAFEKGWPG